MALLVQRILNNGFKFFNLFRKFSTRDVQLVLWVFQYPIAPLLSFEHIWT